MWRESCGNQVDSGQHMDVASNTCGLARPRRLQGAGTHWSCSSNCCAAVWASAACAKGVQVLGARANAQSSCCCCWARQVVGWVTRLLEACCGRPWAAANRTLVRPAARLGWQHACCKVELLARGAPSSMMLAPMVLGWHPLSYVPPILHGCMTPGWSWILVRPQGGAACSSAPRCCSASCPTSLCNRTLMRI
jgi:hypothetical protein